MADLLQLVMDGMNWPKSKAQEWFNTPNHLLGDATPNGYCIFVGHERLERFIRKQIKENNHGLV